jgi:hypothetical protein
MRYFAQREHLYGTGAVFAVGAEHPEGVVVRDSRLVGEHSADVVFWQQAVQEVDAFDPGVGRFPDRQLGGEQRAAVLGFGSVLQGDRAEAVVGDGGRVHPVEPQCQLRVRHVSSS